MVTLINCSYRINSNTKKFLDMLNKNISIDRNLLLKNVIYDDSLIDELNNSSATVLGIPLYVDAPPSQVIELFEILEKSKKKLKCLNIYILTNMGFYEAKQTDNLINIVKCWCDKMNFNYKGGLIIGAGELFSVINKISIFSSNLHSKIKTFSKKIENVEMVEELYVEPRIINSNLYKIIGNISWKKKGIKK